ncbi:MATE family efflux transporter [Jeongeupia chitinilytica]|uniref:MATE family efflux transporter n=1 Tax=Jeongeupia chitinilytica TaxID=1041641 RepID=A0ABQ3H0X5_9NEIS|nr:MATE family efflux transporter [Jeongeupia chitinilytica]GHD63168.1 MATE family efflux transporter [Jeongeupia chitinilytica]
MSASLPAVTDSAAWHRRVLRLAVPVVLANLTQPLMSAVDTAVAGHLPDPAYLGGVALGGLLLNFVFWGFGFLRMGTTGLVAQAHGAGDAEALRATLARALLLAFGLGAALLLLKPLLLGVGLAALGGSAEVQSHAAAYAGARIWAAPFALGNYVVLGFLLGTQQVRLALGLQIWINLVNAAAVFGYVYGLDAGVAGIGAATATADVLGFLAGAMLLWRHVRGASRAVIVDRGALWRLVAINRDIFIRTICLLFGFAWFARAGAAQGDAVLAANALLLNFQTFMAYGLDGFAHAAEALAGSAVGAQRRDALKQTVRVTLIWSLGVAAVFSLVYAAFGPFIVRLLTDQAAVRDVALHYLPWVVVAPLLSAWGFLFDGIFIGATRTGALMRCMLWSLGGFAVAVTLLPPVLGNHGLWLAFSVLMLLRGVTLALALPSLLRAVGAAERAR